jgi:hypothetical protein
MKQEIVLIGQVIDSDSHAPMTIHPVTHAGIKHQKAIKLLIGISIDVAIVDRRIQATAITPRQYVSPLIIGSISGCQQVSSWP